VASAGGTILDRAVRFWEESPFAFLYPVLAHPQPEQYELARRIAMEHRGYFDEELLALLSSPNPVVVAQVLTILQWMNSPALSDLPEELFSDKRQVTIAGCLLVSKSLGEIARECIKET
jgi:hypothetical protein